MFKLFRCVFFIRKVESPVGGFAFLYKPPPAGSEVDVEELVLAPFIEVLRVGLSVGSRNSEKQVGATPYLRIVMGCLDG